MAAGSHRFAVLATNTSGQKWESVVDATVAGTSSCSAPTSPGVNICMPASGSTVNSPVQVQAAALVTGTIASTQLWVDGAKKYSTASTSLNTSISLSAGTHRFAVLALNTAGQKWETAIDATVKSRPTLCSAGSRHHSRGPAFLCPASISAPAFDMRLAAKSFPSKCFLQRRKATLRVQLCSKIPSQRSTAELRWTAPTLPGIAKSSFAHSQQPISEANSMTHAVRIRILTFCLAVLPAGMVFSLLLLSPLAALSQTPTFSTHSFSSSAGNVVTLHGDFNNDGYEDLIIGTRVYLSNGNGTYRAPLTYTLPKGSAYYSAVVGDFNGDGKLDLVVETFFGGEGNFGFSTYLGNGDGTFRAPINQTVEYLYPAMAAADVNHDGKLDLLVITAHSAASLQVLFGNGDGTFTPGPIYGGDLMYEVDTILTGDFDGDGNVDVAVVWLTGPPADGPAGGGGTQFEVLSGDGTGNFALTYGFYCCGYYWTPTAADVNGDGISDLISPTQDLGQNPQPNLTVFYGAPNRAMQFAQIPTERCAVWPYLGASPIAVADFNGDGIPDIAFSDVDCNGTAPPRITILPGKGGNQFGFDIPVFTASSIFPLVVALRGNRDTKADLVFTTPTTKNTPIVMLLNTAAGNFPTCAAPNAAVGIAFNAVPTARRTVNSPVSFAIGVCGSCSPSAKSNSGRTARSSWNSLRGVFSNYGFLDPTSPTTRCRFAQDQYHHRRLGESPSNRKYSSSPY